MKIGVMVESFRAGLDGGLAAAAELGADGVQMYATSGATHPDAMDKTARADLRKKVADMGLEFSAICADFGGHGFQVAEENPKRVEDSKKVVDLTLELGCDVVTAASAEEAAKAFVMGSFDLVTLDNQMPGLKGLDLHRILSQEFGSGKRTTGFAVRSLPAVLVITAYAEDPDVKQLRSGEGIVGVVQKPVGMDDLAAVLSDLREDADAGCDEEAR